ncbi:MAG: 3-hexulose-6-phosphate synthase [Eubacteriales bacterium]|nr:3-hexulose-6-phosphate synthase [Eubacteriales bacterium]
MKLQIAVDIADTAKTLEIGRSVHDIVDIFEVGTPVLLKEGMAPVRALKKTWPDLTVLADSKIVDGGALECEDVCQAGADILTVLAMSDDETIREVVEVAHRYGRSVLADLICVRDITGRARELTALGVDYVCVHTGVDMQKRGRTPLLDLTELVQAIEPSRAAVAGGISMKTLPQYLSLQPGIIIAGCALYGAPDVRAAALEMKGAIRSWI